MATTSKNFKTSSSIMEGLTTGGVYMRINKTANGEYRYVKLTPGKLSAEHAQILLDSIILKEIKGGGRKAKLSDMNKKDTRVDGLNVQETINLLALMGDRTTNPAHPNNVEKFIDRNKQLWIDYSDGKKILHYGENTLDIYENHSDQRSRDHQNFIDWATANKNYRIPIENKDMALSLNDVYQKAFKIGSFTNDPKNGKTYAATLMDTNIAESGEEPRYILSTNVDRVKDTTTGKYVESLTHSPVIDINTRSLDISERKVEPEPVVSIKPINKQSSKSNEKFTKISDELESKIKSLPNRDELKVFIDNVILKNPRLTKESLGETVTVRPYENDKVISESLYNDLPTRVFQQLADWYKSKDKNYNTLLDVIKEVFPTFTDNDIKKSANRAWAIEEAKFDAKEESHLEHESNSFRGQPEDWRDIITKYNLQKYLDKAPFKDVTYDKAPKQPTKKLSLKDIKPMGWGGTKVKIKITILY
jgi:hypothetical protein